MAEENDDQGQQGQNNNDKNKKQGDGVRVYISRPTGDNKEVVTAGNKEGKYNIHLVVGQSRKPASKEEAVKIFANDVQVGDVYQVTDSTPVEIENEPLDPTRRITFSVRRIGQARPDDSMPPLDISKVKKPTKSAAPKRFDVIVAPFTAGKKNAITFVTRDENLKKAKGTVIFSLGQAANVDNTDYEDEDKVYMFETGDGNDPNRPRGMCSTVIKLTSKHTTVSFHHEESGETVLKSLLFKP